MRLHFFIALAATSSLSAADSTALSALKLIPQDKAAKLVRIEARDGTPNPDRWYLLINDPQSENGVREFVVSNNEVVASRTSSQFVDSLKPEDAIGSDGVKIDSDQAAQLARQYALANNAAISKIDYELTKEGADAAPVWKISCLDENDKRVGQLVITAGKGNVISHDGFPTTPKATADKKPKFDVYVEPQVARNVPSQSPAPGDTNEQARRRSGDDRGGNPVGNAAKSVGRTIRKFLPF